MHGDCSSVAGRQQHAVPAGEGLRGCDPRPPAPGPSARPLHRNGNGRSDRHRPKPEEPGGHRRPGPRAAAADAEDFALRCGGHATGPDTTGGRRQ